MAERMILCGPVREGDLPLADPRPLQFALWGPHANIRFRFEDMRRAMLGDVAPAFRDLLDIAVYVYAADQAIPRGSGTDQDLGESWRRRLFFRIPVRLPELWAEDRVHEQLLRSLSFLTEDEYHFQFEPLREEPDFQGYFDFRDGPDEGTAEEVMLFSGGLDSFGGVVREALLCRRRVLLVHHRSASKRAPRHEQLLQRLRERARDAPPWQVAVRIDKAKRFDREFTQRSRSFLFAGLGAALAVMAGRNRVSLYENGVVSINLPPSAQVVGARASRTTHPQVLCNFTRLFTQLAGRLFEVDNPFRWDTKADVVRLIVQAGCADLIGLTTSCAHTWEMTRQHTHCGACAQCIDRRFAVLAAGQGDADPAGAYAVDLLTGERRQGHPRTMLAVYLETANQLAEMGLGAFLGRYGEVTRVLRYAGESPEAAALKVFQLYQKHAREVTGVVDQALRQQAPALRRRQLPPSCLIRLVLDPTGAEASPGVAPSAFPPSTEPPPLAENVFRRRGSGWQVRFASGPELWFPSHKGFAYLHLLLSRPGRPFSVAELACVVARDPRRFALGDAGERLDQEARSAYEARYQELQEELDEARANNDPAAQGRARSEMAALHDELQRARALRGRKRRDCDDRNRVRLAVRAAIRRAVEEIGRYDPRLAEHLSNPRLRCGWSPCYTPGQDIPWET